jgi:hypothetical protein
MYVYDSHIEKEGGWVTQSDHQAVQQKTCRRNVETVRVQKTGTTGSVSLYERWKLPTPSCIAVRNFALITSFEEYSGSLR